MSFHYLGDGLCPGGGCELANIARIRAAWGKFCELQLLLLILKNIISKVCNAV